MNKKGLSIQLLYNIFDPALINQQTDKTNAFFVLCTV
jgi:hypothetical protein